MVVVSLSLEHGYGGIGWIGSREHKLFLAAFLGLCGCHDLVLFET
jgi:hypothetical protein